MSRSPSIRRVALATHANHGELHLAGIGADDVQVGEVGDTPAPGGTRLAVDRLSLEISPGELFAFLGPNGAGKTTTIKMLITLLLPTSGSARVLGHDVVAEPREVRKRIGYVFGGDRGLYERLSGLDNLRYFAELYGVPPREQKARIGELLELVGLSGREGERVEGYSRGMRQKVGIIQALIGTKEVADHRNAAKIRLLVIQDHLCCFVVALVFRLCEQIKQLRRKIVWVSHPKVERL